MTIRRVTVLAPMTLELDAVVARFGMTEHDGGWASTLGDVQVDARLTTIGMAPAAEVATGAIDGGTDHVMIVGIAGAVRPDLAIGTVIEPAWIEDRRSNERFSTGVPGDSVLSCGDDFITDPDALDALAARRVIALDMESAAVVGVCAGRGVGWTVVRAISDHAGGGLIDPEIFAMTNPDGSADGIAEYLRDHPEQVAVLSQLGHDSGLAAANAADTAFLRLRSLSGV
jgi:uridine phosphorylase